MSYAEGVFGRMEPRCITTPGINSRVLAMQFFQKSSLAEEAQE